MGYVQEARENHVKKKVEEGRTLSVVWRCRKQAKQLNDCLHLLCRRIRRKLMIIDYLIRTGRRLMVVRSYHRFQLFWCLGTNDGVLEEMKREYMLEQDVKASAGV
ncbi:uncharacterized protein LOC131153842 isoform X4 [Malania oleifera]|uniref:uncharacterized protein LOC131153842 isoform X4 n=1 Tax=Malania oleifera TaxID=397392 RepID=UPI0025AEB8DB|nr:uncharacterized protein LOC131153842 isoform X4 [Malania oleifera]